MKVLGWQALQKVQMHSKLIAEQCWPFLLFLGIQMPDSSSVPNFPRALNASYACVTVSSQVLKAELRGDAMECVMCWPWMDGAFAEPLPPSLLTCHLFSHRVSRAALHCQSPSSVLCECRNHHLGCEGVLSSRKCAWRWMSCLTRCPLYIWAACQGGNVV